MGCGSESTKEGGLKVEAIETTETSEKTQTADNSEKSETIESAQAQETGSAITEQQALEAVQKYYATIDPDIMNELSSEDYPTYFDVSTNENGEIVVIFRAYTGAINRYYVDPATGETYVTEFVPGIIDEETRTEETFNVKDYQ